MLHNPRTPIVDKRSNKPPKNDDTDKGVLVIRINKRRREKLHAFKQGSRVKLIGELVDAGDGETILTVRKLVQMPDVTDWAT
jgi:hypothetical protein